MRDPHEIIGFSFEGEKILGVVIEHYTNPLDDFYIVYADYALHRVSNPDEDSVIIIDDIIIPACDMALSDFRLKRQHLSDMNRYHQDMDALIEAIKAKIKIE